MLAKETLKKSLINFIELLDTGNSDYSDSELNEILETINKITNNNKKLSKYQACEYLNVSRATFDNWVRSGKLPEGKKEAGFKEKFWEMRDLKRVKNER